MGKAVDFYNKIRPAFLPEIKSNPEKNAHYGYSQGFYSYAFTGEKNTGEMGPVKKYVLDFETLRLRSHQCMLDSEVAQLVIKNKVLWTIGNGLKLQAIPAKSVLQLEGIDIDFHRFTKEVEAYFNLARKSKRSSYNGLSSLDGLGWSGYKDAEIGGDVVVVLRYVDGDVKMQLIDGAHLQTPSVGSKFFPLELKNGNKILKGIEKDPTGKHIRYYIKNDKQGFDVIECVGKKTGFKMAWIYYADKYRLDDDRGLPLLSSVLETLKKMDRYKEATIASAEECAKIPFAIEHTLGSTGENPFLKTVIESNNYDESTGKNKSVNYDEVAKRVAKTTNKTVVNLPVNSKLVSFKSESELHFKDFYTIHIEIVCACLGIPPEVAMAKYNSNYSASRAAIKAWEHVLMVSRQSFADDFYQPFYEFWLHIQILENRISAPGYLEAYIKGNNAVLDAYRQARFVGPPVQGIDPLKEVKAVREALGTAGAHIPLMTVEAGTEALGGGDADSNAAQFADELDMCEEFKPEIPQPVAGTEPAKKPKVKTEK
jgi:capsid protein